MPFKVTKREALTSDGFHPVVPPVFLDVGEIVERRGRKPVYGTMHTEVYTRDTPVREGWLPEGSIVPLYGQTERKEGLTLSGNQETKDMCNRFAKQLDALPLVGDERTSFMIGMLQCEDLDGGKVFYAAIAGNERLPAGWEACARQIGAIPSPNIKEGHSRNLSGVIIKNLSRVGPRRSAPPGAQIGGLGRNGGNWDTKRQGNKPETCAAQKMLQAAIKDVATMRHMWEQWYDYDHGDMHGKAIESCSTCMNSIPRLLDRN